MINKLFLDLNNFKANLGGAERGDSIELNIKLLNSQDYSNSKFRLLGAKSDGKFVEQIEGMNLDEQSNLKIILEEQFVNCEGIVKMELNVVSRETETTTKEFYFFVSNTMNGEIVESADSIPTLEKVSKYVDDAVNNLDALKEASEDITIINSEFKENEIKRKANEMLREKNEKARLQSEDIRITEEEERVANELERIQAENDRKVSERNRKLSENTRKTNEAARVEAELNRQSLFEENEEIRNENENLRIEAEKERKLAFSNNNKFESERVEAEKLRAIAEDKRVTAEKARAKAEEERVKAETRRENTYTDFNDSEAERKNNEIKRQEAEALRVEAETRRDNLFSEKEEERNTSFIESEKVRNAAFNKAQDSRNTTFEESETVREEAFKISEKARNDAEELRVTAESERVKSEKLRVDSEKARVLAEEERNTTFTQKEEERNNTFTQNETNRNTTFTQSEEERKTTFEEAENARKVAESKRVKAESSRVEAEKLRVAAETERVEAENLRVTAEEERVAAETKRDEKIKELENKIDNGGNNSKNEEVIQARTATTGEVFNTLDERIDNEVDRLNKKIEVSMLQQEDKESHTVENTVDGMTTDMVVKGRTLNNLYKANKIREDAGGKYIFVDTFEEYAPKDRVVYIVNNTNRILLLNVYRIGGGWDSNPIIRENSITKLDLTGKRLIGFLGMYDRGWANNETDKELLKNTCIALDREETYMPKKYFEGIKSFGEQESNEISILSHGKNILNIKDWVHGSWSGGHGNFETPPTTVNKRIASKEKNILLTNNKIIFSGNKPFNVAIRYYDNNNNFIPDYVGFLPDKTSTPPKNAKYYNLIIAKQDINEDINIDWFNSLNLQMEEGVQSTPYEPCKCDKKDILLQNLGFDEGLRGLNNSVYDELNVIRGVAIRRVDKGVLNSEWNWMPDGVTNEYGYIRFYTTNIPLSSAGYVIDICDKMPTLQKSHKYDCNGITRSGSGYFEICIDNNLIGGSSPENLKTWLQANPLTVYYELAEPVETPLDENINLKTFGERTYIGFENSISGTSSFKAPVNAAATISRLNRENRALEEENRNLRQDFESTTLTLTDSDLDLVKQNVDMDFRLMEVEFALDIPQAILSSNIKFKNKKGEVKSMARTPYEMMKIVILSGDYDREDYMYKVGKYYERGRMTKEEHDELMSLMTADEVISK